MPQFFPQVMCRCIAKTSYHMSVERTDSANYVTNLQCIAPLSVRCLSDLQHITWDEELVRLGGASGPGPSVRVPIISRVKPEALITRKFRPSEQPFIVVCKGHIKN